MTTGVTERSLQQRFAPRGICFGCGPANEHGLQIRSFATDDNSELVCDFAPQPHHAAFPGVLNGGICGAILDCHCNWAAAYHLYVARGRQEFPATVTAEYTIKLHRPTGLDDKLSLRARVVASDDPKVRVEGTLWQGDSHTASCEGLFIAVGPGHPAHDRWNG